MKLLTLNLLYLIIQCQPNQHQSNSDDDNVSYNNITTSIEEEISVSQFLTTILIVGLTLLFLSKLFQKKTHPIDRNRNKINLDELNQRMNSIAQKLQDGNMELTYSFNGQWVQQKVEKVSVQQNIDTLTFHFNGSDCYGSWNQIGVINISQSNQVDTFSRKMYDNAKIQDGDVLIYYGQFDDQDQSFKGHWYGKIQKEQVYTILKVRKKGNGYQNLNELQYFFIDILTYNYISFIQNIQNFEQKQLEIYFHYKFCKLKQNSFVFLGYIQQIKSFIQYFEFQ